MPYLEHKSRGMLRFYLLSYADSPDICLILDTTDRLPVDNNDNAINPTNTTL